MTGEIMTETLVIGGTGLLGHHTIKELLRRNYNVSSLALPLKEGEANNVPDAVTAHWGDAAHMTDSELLAILKGQYAVFFAIGVDERIVPPTPAAHFFYEENVVLTQRIVRLCREAEVQKFVLYGSYTAQFGEEWPDLGYREHNGYPRTRLAQEEVAILEGWGAMDVMVLRLPYIFGLVEGQRPLWQMVLDAVNSQEVMYVGQGSTSSVTVRQVAQAALGAMEKGTHGAKYPINSYELTYLELNQIAARMLGQDPAKVQAVPVEAILPAYQQIDEQSAASGVEHGVHMADTARFQGRRAVTDPTVTMDVLGIEPDDVVAAIEKSFQWCLDNPPAR